MSATHIFFLGLFLFALAVVTYWMTKGIDQAIIDGAVQTCVGYIKPQGDVENTVIETKGEVLQRLSKSESKTQRNL